MHQTSLPTASNPWLDNRTRVIAASVFLIFAGFTLIHPIVPFLVGEYVAAADVPFWVACILSIYALCQFVAAPILGALSDRFGRRPVLLLSLLGSATGYLIFAIGGSLRVLLAGRVVEGLTAGSVSAMYAYVADVTPPEQRGRVFGLLGAAGGFGFMLGPVAGGALGEISLSAPVFVAAALTFANVLWVYFALAESRDRDADVVLNWQRFNPLAQLFRSLRIDTLRKAFAGAFLFCFAGVLLQANIAVYVKDVLSFGPSGIGLMLFAVGVMDIVSQGVLATRLLPRLGEQRVASYGLCLNAVGFLGIAAIVLHSSVGLLVASIFIFTLGDGLFQPAINSMIANAVPAEMQGSVQGANQGQQAMARTLAPLLAAYLYSLAPAAPYLVGAGVVLAGMLAI
jgi:DHA1 family tetracycline resistance protein-like MFS transporter